MIVLDAGAEVEALHNADRNEGPIPEYAADYEGQPEMEPEWEWAMGPLRPTMARQSCRTRQSLSKFLIKKNYYFENFDFHSFTVEISFIFR